MKKETKNQDYLLKTELCWTVYESIREKKHLSALLGFVLGGLQIK